MAEDTATPPTWPKRLSEADFYSQNLARMLTYTPE